MPFLLKEIDFNQKRNANLNNGILRKKTYYRVMLKQLNMEEIITHNPINESQSPEIPVTNDLSGNVHHSGKKRLKDYLQEGLMIFVAVVMGFLAENVREGIGNREKEKQYMRSYVKNLRQDSTTLQRNIFENSRKVNYLDSLLGFSRKDISTVSNRVALYYYCIRTVGYYSEFSIMMLLFCS